MSGILIFSIILSACIFIAVLVIFIRTLVKDKRMEDAMQRQRERQNDEMWRRINEEVAQFPKNE